MGYCTHCGKVIGENDIICLNCGCKVDENVEKESHDTILINTIISRFHMNSIIWIIISIIQICVGISQNTAFIVIGILNIIFSLVDIIFCANYKIKHKGLLKKVKPLIVTVIILIYNLCFGGLIAIIGTSYYLAAVRYYVIDNEEEFLRIEKDSLNMEV